MSSIFEMAKEKERRMAQLYRNLATECKNKGIKNVLTMLAEQESKHFEMVSSMEQKSTLEENDTEIMSSAKDLFSKIKEQKLRMNLNTNQVQLYREVKNFEKENEEFYRQMAVESDSLEMKQVLNKFADEEHRHFLLMSEIMDFVERPDQWIENAEFNHIEEY